MVCRLPCNTSCKNLKWFPFLKWFKYFLKTQPLLKKVIQAVLHVRRYTSDIRWRYVLIKSSLNYKSLGAPILRKKSYPCNRLLRPIRLWDVQASTFSRKSGLKIAVKLSALRNMQQKFNHWIFVGLTSVRSWIYPRVEGRKAGRIRPIDKCYDFVGILPLNFVSFTANHYNYFP
jgi:hypothetical protein